MSDSRDFGHRRTSFCIQWKRTPAEGPNPTEDNGPYLMTFLHDVVQGKYFPEIGDCMIMLTSPHSPSGNGLVTMHPGDWLYFDAEGHPVIIPDHIHQALDAGLASTSLAFLRRKA